VYTGTAAGVDTINYTVTSGCGTAVAVTTVTVNPVPTLTSSVGPDTICNGVAFTYTPTSTVTGTVFTWTRAMVSGITNPAGAGTGAIIETLHNTMTTMATATYIYILSAGGCNDTATLLLNVQPTPVADPITGPTSLCVGVTVTLSDATTGGTWSATNSYAFVSSTGVVNGLSAGVDTVMYNAITACGPVTAFVAVTVTPLPSAGAITGTDSVCMGHAITLSDIAGGGTWNGTSGNALVSSGGVVLGVAAGADDILYVVTNSCGNDTAHMNIQVIDCALGVTEKMPASKYLVIYPNPAHTDLSIVSPALITNVTITDVFGRTVYTQEHNARHVRADISTLMPGVYMVEVNGSHAQRVIKE
jgi:hypothetical protein